VRSDGPVPGSIVPASTVLVELVDGAQCVAVWPLAGVRRDLAVVDTLARLQLAARRLGWSIQVRNADAELRALLEFVGLTEVLALEPSR
jgi:hypothetical protein